ncbi:MAG: 7-carboxy-7-deazaguanine synthase QueE [Candidatus Omnitrophica bacterium]|nr:7-carboxy-7-deazaguanine synthase QueE [Candidatus Omnitrophota bacterium]
MDKAKISELFCSLQGEGIYWGKKQIFVRFYSCNMKCVYCDEEEKTFHGPYEEIDVETLRNRLLLLELENGPFHSISLTGGEPLLYADFLKRLSPLLKEDGFRLYLETNGTYPERLREVISWMDIIAMDIKLPTATHDRAFWKEHREFLEVGRRKGLFVKIVVTAETAFEEVERAIEEVARVDCTIPFILQPVTPYGEVAETIPEKSLFSFEQRARSVLKDVRVISQLHKLVGIL